MSKHTTMAATTASSSERSAAEAVAGGFFQRLKASWQSRRAAYDLLRLDDRSLADIGLFRTDIESALTLRWGEDCSSYLARCRQERRDYRGGLDRS